MLQTTKRLMRPAIMLSGQETADILLYITGAVHGFTASEPEKAFAVRDLFGGKNSDWASTPLQTIFNRYSEDMPKEEAAERAGIDVGRLLKIVLDEDKYTYLEEETDPRTCRYIRIVSQ